MFEVWTKENRVPLCFPSANIERSEQYPWKKEKKFKNCTKRNNWQKKKRNGTQKKKKFYTPFWVNLSFFALNAEKSRMVSIKVKTFGWCKKRSIFFLRLSLKIKFIFSVRFPEHFAVERKHFHMQCLQDFWQTIPLYFSQTISHDFPQSISHDFWQTLHLPISHRWCISTSLRRHKKLFPPFPFWTFCKGQSFINFDKLC